MIGARTQGSTLLAVARPASARAVGAVAGAVLLCASLLSAAAPSRALAPPLVPPLSPGRTEAPGVPTVSIIASPTVLCNLLDPEADVCAMSWADLSVSTGSSNYVTYLTVKIDGKVRAVSTGFFQSTMAVPFAMYQAGLEVACGRLGAGGDPVLGAAHTYFIEAFDSAGTYTSNFGAVICPASVLLFADGFESGTSSAWSVHQP